MEKKSSPKYWKASHQLLIHWFPNFNNTQHFYNYRPKGRFFKYKTKVSNFSYTYTFKVFYSEITVSIMS